MTHRRADLAKSAQPALSEPAPFASVDPRPSDQPPVFPARSFAASPPCDGPPANRPPLPPEVVLVAVVLVALGGLVLYPVIRYGGPVVPALFDGNDTTRAFAAVALEVFAILAASGVSMIALAIGLVRGSRAAQVLTGLLCTVVAIAEIAASQRSSLYSDGSSDGVAAGVAVAGLLVVILITTPPNARAFYAADPRPGGVITAAVANLYLGFVGVLSGALLMAAGAVDVEFVWAGVALAGTGLCLVALNRPLRAGIPAARAATLAVYIALLAALLYSAHATHSFAAPSTYVPATLIVVACGGLFVAPGSAAHFRPPRVVLPPAPLSLLGSALVAVLVIGVATFGFHAAAKPYGQTYVADSPQLPTYSDASAPGVTQDDAYTVVRQSVDALRGTGSVNTCDGSLPGLDVYDYRIDDVSPRTDGTYAVTVDVSLNDGAYEAVTYTVGADSSGEACVEADTVQTSEYSPDPSEATGQPAVPSQSAATAPTEPDDVPSLPSSSDPIPADASLPDDPTNSSVIAYGDSTQTPTTADELLEWSPDGLDADQADAVRDVIGFMTQINRQNFQPAWELSTETLSGPEYSRTFAHGYRTSRFYQVALGQPETVSDDLIVVPGRFVSRQDPAAQGDPDGVTDCTYWPQYVFIVARRHGHWLLDVAGKFGGRSELDSFKRYSQGTEYLNPLSQRVAC